MIEDRSSKYFFIVFCLKVKLFVNFGYFMECRVNYIVLNLLLWGKLEIYSWMVVVIFLKIILIFFRRRVLYIDLDI